jgi:hypothetical protein
MPNMDDIAFFDSQPYQHRGGIWQDASRREKHPSVIPEQIPADSQSTVPALAPEAPSAPLSQEPSSQPRSQSAEELSNEVSSSPISTNDMVPDVTAPELPVLPRGNNRRRSWFSSVRSETRGSMPRRSSDAEEVADWDEQRGRAAEPDKMAASAPRSHSTPHSVDSLLPATPTQERDDPYLDTHLSPQSAHRSPSLLSSTREHGKSKSIDSSDTPSDAISTPSKNNSSIPSSSPNSFLSTLKSRAGDKQALSNTAKEAMRKWGVNWANLRKDSSNRPSPSDDAASDHGSIGSLIGSRLQPDSHSGVASKTRASYAEVRAAVEERKGKDKNAHSRPSSPIPIPGASTDNAADGDLLAAAPQGSNSSSFPNSVSRSHSSASSSGRLSVGEKSNTSRKSSPGPSRSAAEPDVQDRSEQVQLPIHVVQPQAKTMTIPGIHASHRGEIMSMGYVAPQQQQEGKPPSIQSVYRLWKSPSLSGQDQQQRPLPQTQQSQDPSLDADGDSGERDRDISVLVSPPSATISPLVSPRPVPPPLPPRSTPVGVSRPPFEVSTSPPSESSASQTLKSIVNKDELKRASLENGNVPPPVSRIDTEPLVAGSSDSESVNSDHSPPKTPTKPISISNPGPPLPPRRIP